jgi:hypothetical protein
LLADARAVLPQVLGHATAAATVQAAATARAALAAHPVSDTKGA